MNKNRLFVLLLISIIPQTTCLAVDDGDFQYWNTTTATLDLDQDWGLFFEQEMQFGNDAGELLYNHYDAGVTYKGLASWLECALNFRLIMEKDSKRIWRQENRPHFNFTIKDKIGNFDFKTRSRFEFRDRETNPDCWRYRNKFTLKHPVTLGNQKFDMWVADEVFVPLDEVDFDRNRFYVGLDVPVWDNFKASLYYLWQASKSSSTAHWNDLNILGVQLKLKF